MKNIFVIIDGNAILHRAWHAMPPLATKDGRLVSAAYGFTVMLMKVLKDLKPTHLTVTFDLPGGTFRHEAFEAYKAHRVKQPDELYAQIPMVKRILEGYRIPVYEMPGYEADDVIGTLSKKAPKGAETIIVTGDNDTLQLVDGRTKVYTQRKGMSDVVVYDEAAVKERYGLEPSQLIDYKAMRGDASDNLPGLKGIGEKGATELLQRYGSLEKIYAAAKKSPNDFKPGILKALVQGEKDVPLSKRLVTIVRDLPLDFDFREAAVRGPDVEKLREAFRDFEFKTLLAKLESGTAQAASAKAQGKAKKPGKKMSSRATTRELEPELFAAKDTAKFLKTFKGAVAVAFRFAYAERDRIAPSFSALAMTDGRHLAALRLDGSIPDPLRDWLEGASVRKIGHDIKEDAVALLSAGVRLGGILDDVMLMSYLLNPGSRAHALSDLVFEATGKADGAQKSLFEGDPAETACKEASHVEGIARTLSARLETEGLKKVYEDIERPLLPVLAAMERHGIKVDVKFLDVMAGRLRARIDEITAAVTKAAGEEFNVNSPAQLQRILFEKLSLPTKGIRRTSTGQLSTGADELEKLRGAHPIVGDIFEHREYSKLLSTYVAAIPGLIHPRSGRLHTHFNQAVTATGRLSSSDPNLQNIPVRTELGREIRKAFIAEKGRLLLAADYSQFELRIAASIADDRKMIEAFKSGADFHTSTAAEIWGVEPDQVTFEQRRAAKAINFGILYGMGANSLAAAAGLSRNEAGDFIRKYLGVYSGLKAYMEQAKVQAKSLGYVETLFGRRRYLPDIDSGVPYLKAEAERMAINMPIQGTQADIIKLAMIRLHERIVREYGLGREADLKMLLQVHDELVFECREDLAEEVAPWIKETMESAVELKVPVDVEVEVGKNWGGLQAL
jgi:DNA polymerase-1